MAGKLYALFVGISNYSKNPLPRAAASAEKFYSTIKARIPIQDKDRHKLLLLTNDNATREKVINGLKEFYNVPDKDDVFLFYFAGHGSQEKAPAKLQDVNPTNQDGARKEMLESILCIDSRKVVNNKYVHEIADKEIAYIISKITSKGAHFVAIMDCCHSGNNTRKREEDAQISTLPTNTTPRLLKDFLGYEESPSSYPPAVQHLQIAACEQLQQAQDSLLTAMLIEELNNGGFKKTYNNLIASVQRKVSNRLAEQTPKLFSKNGTLNDCIFLNDVFKKN